MIRRLASRFAFWALCASFPSVRRAPRGRFARARLVWSCRFPNGSSSLLLLCGPVAVHGVALSEWCGPVGFRLAGLAFRWV